MSNSPGAIPSDQVAEMFQINLKNRSFAALLAWLIPGAGHLYQGRTAKGLVFMICITSTFVFGMYLGGGKVAYASPKTVKQMRANDPGRGRLVSRVIQAMDRWPAICQSGIGSVAIPMLVERSRFLAGRDALFPGGIFRPPRDARDGPITHVDASGNTVRHPTELAKWTYQYGFYFELGTIYTVVAGLLNVLAVYDAHAGPLIPAAREDADGKDEPEKPQGDKTG
ncbi:MAG: DUF6677 family protein [Planctomycetota bacterium]